MEPARRAECRAVLSGFMKLVDGMQVIDLTEKRHAESMVLAAEVVSGVSAGCWSGRWKSPRRRTAF